VTETGIIAGVSVSHERATVDQIETVAEEHHELVRALLADHGIEEAFALATCNRTEAYVVADDRTSARASLSDVVVDVPEDAVRELGHEESLRHLMRVAAGLESLVLGEDQILGQVRTAYAEAREAGGIGPVLDDALLKVLHVGERARDETAINEGTVSLGSAAVGLVREEHGLDDATGMVVGAGEMGALAASALADHGEALPVANRTVERARQLAGNVDTDTEVLGLGAVPDAVERTDVVVTATNSPEPVLEPGDLRTAGETYVVDVAQPRDVDPESEALDGVTVRDLDALEAIADRTREQRHEAAEAVEAIVDDELDHLLAQYKRKRADRVIAAMYEGAEHLKERELETARSRLDAADDDDERREVLDALADALVSQLLSAPTRSLRDAAENDDWETIHTALRLFDPSVDREDLLAGEDTPTPEEIPPAVREQVPPAVLDELADD